MFLLAAKRFSSAAKFFYRELQGIYQQYYSHASYYEYYNNNSKNYLIEIYQEELF